MASQPIYQFYAELAGYTPKLWRRFQVACNITMARLGYIVMTMYEMEANHLFCFDVPFEANFRKCAGEHITNAVNRHVIDMLETQPESKTIHIELPDEETDFDFNSDFLDAGNTKLQNVLTKETEEITFTYDFGDGWDVKLSLEKIFVDKELPAAQLPRVLEGAGYGIIEDCGGAGRLQDLAKAFQKKKGREYKEFRIWLGRDDLDLAAFDLDDMNFRLKKVPRIYSDVYERHCEPSKHAMDILERKYLK